MAVGGEVASKTFVDREKTAPFLVRTFVKIGSFHRAEFFEDGRSLPTTDEHQIFTWRDASLREVITSLRLTTNSTEVRHPLAKFMFRSVYADSYTRGRITTRDLGTVYSRDIRGELGTLESPAPRLLTDTEGEDDSKTLEELRFVPGDYLSVSVILPKFVTGPDVSIRGAAGGPAANGWKNAGPLSPVGPPGGLGRGGGHWRGGSEPSAGRGRGGRAERPRRYLERDVDSDRRVPPPRRRDSPPARDLYPPRDRSPPSRPRSRSPSRRRYR